MACVITDKDRGCNPYSSQRGDPVLQNLERVAARSQHIATAVPFPVSIAVLRNSKQGDMHAFTDLPERSEEGSGQNCVAKGVCQRSC